MNEPKKLKRGLKDVSPLFQPLGDKEKSASKNLSAEQKGKPGTVEFLSIFSPEAPREASFFNTLIAAKIKSIGYQVAIISIEKETNAQSVIRNQGMAVKRFYLTMSQFLEVCRSKTAVAENFGSSVFLFDFDYTNPIHFEKVVPILDKWILFLKPELESLTEGFKYIKAATPLNPMLEYFMVYHGPDHPRKESMLFERYSDLISQHGGISLSWFGRFDPASPQPSAGIVLDTFPIYSPGDSIEKRAVAGFLYPPKV